jgi:hypothetical protein
MCAEVLVKVAQRRSGLTIDQLSELDENEWKRNGLNEW